MEHCIKLAQFVMHYCIEGGILILHYKHTCLLLQVTFTNLDLQANGSREGCEARETICLIAIVTEILVEAPLYRTGPDYLHYLHYSIH